MEESLQQERKNPLKHGFTENFCLQLFVKPLLKKGVFSPQENQMDPGRLSLWKELLVLYYLISYFVSYSLEFSLDSGKLENLSYICANSKRKRLPKLLDFSLAA